MRFSFSYSRISLRVICAFMMVLSTTLADSKPSASSPHRVFDEYGRVCWENEQARLDNFAVRLEMSPEMIGNIVVYDGRRACHGEAIARAVRAKHYLVEYRHIDPNRVLWRFGGYQEQLNTILMDVPRGYPEWPAEPTVSPKDVVFIGKLRPPCPSNALYTVTRINRWTRAVGARFSTSLVRRRLNEFAPPRQLNRYASNLKVENV